MSARERHETEVLLCADGPMLVPGPVTVEDEAGEQHHSDRPMVALCRCGASSCRPWCDGSHKQLQRSALRPARPSRSTPADDLADDLADY